MFQTSLWMMLAVVMVAGGLGGTINAIISDNGFPLPKTETSSTGQTVLRPGYLGNILVGAVAAVISWGLYGPFSTYDIIGSMRALSDPSTTSHLGLSVAALVGAVLVGVGGSRWLTNEVDKNLLRLTAADAASKTSSPETALSIATSRPATALGVAKRIENTSQLQTAITRVGS